jgi:hypothetical protein
MENYISHKNVPQIDIKDQIKMTDALKAAVSGAMFDSGMTVTITDLDQITSALARRGVVIETAANSHISSKDVWDRWRDKVMTLLSHNIDTCTNYSLGRLANEIMYLLFPSPTPSESPAPKPARKVVRWIVGCDSKGVVYERSLCDGEDANAVIACHGSLRTENGDVKSTVVTAEVCLAPSAEIVRGTSSTLRLEMRSEHEKSY